MSKRLGIAAERCLPTLPPPDAGGSADGRWGARLLRSVEFFAGRKEVMIEHGGQLYRLRCTSKGKLILTK